MLNYTESAEKILKLSPSELKILECFYRHNNRVYSWQLNQECHTAAYSQRIGRLKKMGYVIEKFLESYKLDNRGRIVRHGYTLIPPSKQGETP